MRAVPAPKHVFWKLLGLTLTLLAARAGGAQCATPITTSGYVQCMVSLDGGIVEQDVWISSTGTSTEIDAFADASYAFYQSGEVEEIMEVDGWINNGAHVTAGPTSDWTTGTTMTTSATINNGYTAYSQLTLCLGQQYQGPGGAGGSDGNCNPDDVTCGCDPYLRVCNCDPALYFCGSSSAEATPAVSLPPDFAGQCTNAGGTLALTNNVISVSINTNVPQINSPTPSSDVQGASNVQMTISGSNLIDSFGQPPSVKFSNSGVTGSVNSGASANNLTVTYSVDSAAATGAGTVLIHNRWGDSNPQTFSVLTLPSNGNSGSGSGPDPCAISSNPRSGYSSIVTTATPGSSGTMVVSFGGAAFATISPTVNYGPYSTSSSIAASIAALITRKYLQFGLSAKAFGPNIIYSGTTTLGTVSVSGGPSFATDPSPAAATVAANACYDLAPFPCTGLWPDYDYPRTYSDGSSTPKEHIISKHILGTPTATPPNTVYLNPNHYSTDDMFILVKAYNFVTVLEDPFPKNNYFQHTYPKIIQSTPTGTVEKGFIGIDAAGKDLYTNRLYLSKDRCRVSTSFPVAP